jgi:hypothetical protein
MIAICVYIYIVRCCVRPYFTLMESNASYRHWKLCSALEVSVVHHTATRNAFKCNASYYWRMQYFVNAMSRHVMWWRVMQCDAKWCSIVECTATGRSIAVVVKNCNWEYIIWGDIAQCSASYRHAKSCHLERNHNIHVRLLPPIWDTTFFTFVLLFEKCLMNLEI